MPGMPPVAVGKEHEAEYLSRTRLLGVGVDAVDYPAAVRLVLAWAKEQEGRAVCVANVHVLMEAYDSEAFRKAVDGADLVVPDGMPLVWMLRMKGRGAQQRVYGPQLMTDVLAAAATAGVPVGLYGSTAIVLDTLTKRLSAELPELKLVYTHAPPFHQLTPEEDAADCAAINSAGARILFVGLGCPKQELWMAAHRATVRAVMIGVGAAFDFLAGTKPQAPRWMQAVGLEWLFRLLSEPRRLWRRYLYHNPRFLVLAAADLIGLRRA